jgi:hypothetical protein
MRSRTTIFSAAVARTGINTDRRHGLTPGELLEQLPRFLDRGRIDSTGTQEDSIPSGKNSGRKEKLMALKRWRGKFLGVVRVQYSYHLLCQSCETVFAPGEEAEIWTTGADQIHVYRHPSHNFGAEVGVILPRSPRKETA